MNANTRLELEAIISRMIDDHLPPQESQRLNEMLSGSREAVQYYLDAMDNHEALNAIYPGDVYAAEDYAAEDYAAEDHEQTETNQTPVASQPNTETSISNRWNSIPPGVRASLLALAATIVVVVAWGGYRMGKQKIAPNLASIPTEPNPVITSNEQTIAGHASLRRAIDVQWAIGKQSPDVPESNRGMLREGDVISSGQLELVSGIAEIDFFCGATLIVEGPAEFEVESDWSVAVTRGRLRATVPPAARGFIVKAAGSEIIDLGTEFALQVDPDDARVEVIDGEIKLQGGVHDGDHLLTGQRRWIRGTKEPAAFETLSTLEDLTRRRQDAVIKRFESWRESSQQLRNDDRLIAYYPVVDSSNRKLSNVAGKDTSRDGALVGPVRRTEGRFGEISQGLEFDRTGARVRTLIDGEFKAFTFACWARIDSLDHVYNALFMGDGYENGEPHWQIREDGRLMFSVMVDDSKTVQVTDRFSKQTVKDGGLHRVYTTDPFWDESQSGRWFHLAAVYDPAQRRVCQYVNGSMIADEPIIDEFLIQSLRIGPSEIGNWGQPFRKSPWFAVRNLNGTIDELAIFDAALDATEIQKLYQQGKPLGY